MILGVILSAFFDIYPKKKTHSNYQLKSGKVRFFADFVKKVPLKYNLEIEKS